MKKALLLLIAAVMLPLALGAQALPKAHSLLQRANVPMTFGKRIMTPAFQADLGENQMIMGHYDTDDYSTNGLGLTSQAGTIRIATIIEPDELEVFQGGKIVKFRVGLAAATTISKVFVAPVSASGSIGTATEWSNSSGRAGWNTITLSSPYEINLAADQSLMIGFDYRQTSSNYPISAVAVGDIYPTYCRISGTWYDVGLDSYGNLSVQCIVENEYPEYILGMSELYCDSYVKGTGEFPFTFRMRNQGSASVGANATGIDVKIDGVTVTTLTNPEALSAEFLDIYGSVMFNNMAVGEHTLTVTLNTLNGEPMDNPKTLSRVFHVYETSFPRQNHLVEQFTSTYCTYCPLGSSMLSILEGLRDDVIRVAVHGNMNGTYPMKIAQCDTLMSYMGCDSYPSAAFDRSTGWEDYVNIVSSIGYREQYHQEAAEELGYFLDYISEGFPTFATINMKSNCDKDARTATITVSGDLAPHFDDLMGSDAKLNVYLTEDGIVQRQLNDGTWINDYVHNGVFRQALPSVFGVALNKTGETYSNTFNVTIPSSWNIDNMHVVAFISRPLINGAEAYTDMYINNAEMVPLYTEIEVLRGDVNADNSIDPADIAALINYLLNGEEINMENADCDQNGFVDPADIAALINYLLGGNVWPE